MHFIEKNKTKLNLSLTVLTLLVSALLWENTYVLVVVLMLIGGLMLFIERRKRALAIYAMTFVCGPLSEALMIYVGAWSYTNPDFLGFPLWLPFLWGNCGLLIFRLNMYMHSFSGAHTSGSDTVNI